MNKEFILRNVRISFCNNLVVAKAAKAGDKPRFSTNFILEEGHPQLTEIEDTLAEISKVEFPGRKIEGKDNCLRDGDTLVNSDGEIYEGYKGNKFISGARSEKRKKPRVVNRSRQDIDPTDSEFPEPGDYVNAIVNFYSINGKNDKGGDPTHGKKICCEIGTVQFVRKGESLGGGSGTGNLDDLPEIADEDDVI